MRAAVLHQGRIVVRDNVEEPVPAQGQALVQVKACGICGSDLHFVKHGPALVEVMQQMTASGQPPPTIDFERDVYMGHEFAAEVLELGPNTESSASTGALVTSMPVLLSPSGVDNLVFSNTAKAGYGERMLLSASLLLEVPNGLPASDAAMAEPMAVGLHAVNRASLRPGDGAVVLGCGGIGLAVIAALQAHGTEPIIAVDPSPARRAIARRVGAHEAVDPRRDSAWETWTRMGRGAPVVFEAVGVPGILNDILRRGPARSRVVVVGVCMEEDAINPLFGISKEMSVHFAVAYSRDEFSSSLRSIAEGEIDVAPMVTAEVGLDQVPWAFDALANPEEHCKIIVTP